METAASRTAAEAGDEMSRRFFYPPQSDDRAGERHCASASGGRGVCVCARVCVCVCVCMCKREWLERDGGEKETARLRV